MGNKQITIETNNCCQGQQIDIVTMETTKIMVAKKNWLIKNNGLISSI